MRSPATRFGTAMPLLAAVLLSSAHALASQEVKVPHLPPVLPDIKTPAPVLPAKPARTGPAPIAVQPPLERSQLATKLTGAVASATPTVDPNATYFDQSADGSIWTMGRSYKAQFSANQASYFPNMGPHAPQLYPLSFHAAGADVGGTPIVYSNDVLATRAGDSVQYARGGMTERYSIRSDSIEQEFVFPSLPGKGDLVLRLALDTELARSQSPEGLRFSNDLGHVDYSRAVAVDAAGKRAEAETTLEGDSIRIRVPAAFVEHATLPLTIDPVIVTFAIDTSTSIDVLPDVAYNPNSLGRYLVCWERAYSATDHDVWAQEYDNGGVLVAGSGAYIDFTTAYWANPRVASNWIAANFLVVATVGSTAPRSISGRTRDANSASMGAQFGVSAEASFDCFGATVGGDPVTSGPTYYLVVWNRVFTGTDWDIHAQLVSGSGALSGGMIFIDNSSATLDFDPSVSKCDGQSPSSNQNWVVTWTREFAAGVDYDIWGSQVHWDGTITYPTYSIDFTTAYDYNSQASTVLDSVTAGDRDYMTVYSRYDLVSDNDVHASIHNGTTYVADADLSALDSSVAQNQLNPTVDSDGVNYGVAYAEQFSTSSFDYDMYISTFTRVGSSIKVSEAHQQLDFSTTQDTLPVYTAAHSGGVSGPGGFVVWENYFAGGTDSNITGGLYTQSDFTSFCSPGVDAIACPCGNPPAGANRGCNNSSNTGGAQLSQTGGASIAADTVVFTSSGEKPTATSIFLQGTGVNLTGAVFGQGVRCVGGTLKRLYTKTASAGTAIAPSGGDPSVHVRSQALGDVINPGQNRYYMVYYRDPTVLGGCSASSTFNGTQTAAVSWLQ